MRTRKSMCILLLMIFGACTGAMAQKNIEKVVDEIEKSADAQVSTIKNRDPKSHKVVKIIKTVRITDERTAKKMLAAFEKDEENALTSISDKGKQISYTLKFPTHTCMLSLRNNNTGEVTIIYAPDKAKDIQAEVTAALQGLNGTPLSTDDLQVAVN